MAGVRTSSRVYVLLELRPAERGHPGRLSPVPGGLQALAAEPNSPRQTRHPDIVRPRGDHSAIFLEDRGVARTVTDTQHHHHHRDRRAFPRLGCRAFASASVRLTSSTTVSCPMGHGVDDYPTQWTSYNDLSTLPGQAVSTRTVKKPMNICYFWRITFRTKKAGLTKPEHTIQVALAHLCLATKRRIGLLLSCAQYPCEPRAIRKLRLPEVLLKTHTHRHRVNHVRLTQSSSSASNVSSCTSRSYPWEAFK
ncbi:unnamed protein product [Trichogramma brassicae]|uniref:Uncharacterized protein n=1 Tax=Trichogramma brassicae TaxID=86971 RepID=A0A6H5INA4_9HYME|nr:unnamed protein product [Trichogramma brassicae]